MKENSWFIIVDEIQGIEKLRYKENQEVK